MQNETVSFTMRLPKKLHDRLIHVIAATGNETTRTGIIIQFTEQGLAQLEVCPSMIPGYDPALDKSARFPKRQACKRIACKTPDPNPLDKGES